MSSEIINTLDDYLDQVIVIKLRDNRTIQGNLQGFDQMMNLVLTDSKDISGDDVKNPDKILLRGANIILVSLPDISNQKDDGSI
ncbi:LSM domain-containing protein [Nitrosopumilus sp.]|uniref:LSM domain-containing protein n=1 Tax=Nitrosopumilus sp. TaxID=2024843 RepID=UPI003B5981E9